MVFDASAELRKERNREAQRRFRETKKKQWEEQVEGIAAGESEMSALIDRNTLLHDEKDSLQSKLVQLQSAGCTPIPDINWNTTLSFPSLASSEYVEQDFIFEPQSTALTRITPHDNTPWPDVFDFDFDAPLDQSLVDPRWNNEAVPNPALKIMQDLRSATTREIENLKMLLEDKQAVAQQIEDAVFALQWGTDAPGMDWGKWDLDCWLDNNIDEERVLPVYDNEWWLNL